jgi:hypothetical protein
MVYYARACRRKAVSVNSSPELGGMRRVKLDAGSRTAFWRYHTEGVTEEGVCTIEAMLLLVRAMLQQARVGWCVSSEGGLQWTQQTGLQFGWMDGSSSSSLHVQHR